MQTDHELLLSALRTLFTGGAFLALLVIAWKGGVFIEWVRLSILRITVDFERFEKSNNEAHDRIEGSVVRIKDRVGSLEGSD